MVTTGSYRSHVIFAVPGPVLNELAGKQLKITLVTHIQKTVISSSALKNVS
jgi:hypothetical protein